MTNKNKIINTLSNSLKETFTEASISDNIGSSCLLQNKGHFHHEHVSEADTSALLVMHMTRDHTGTISGTVPARNNVGLVRSQNIFCSGAGIC